MRPASELRLLAPLLAALVLGAACQARPVPSSDELAQAPQSAPVASASASSLPPPVATPAADWLQVLPKANGPARMYFTFQDSNNVWHCEDKRCRTVYGEQLGTTIELACTTSSPTAASHSGRWLAQICGQALVLQELPTHVTKRTELGFEYVNYVIVDDEGVATATTNNGSTFRVTPSGTVRRAQLTPPKPGVVTLPANAPWVAYSDGAFMDEVAWTSSDPPSKVAMGGGALLNGSTIWVSRMDSSYGRLTPTGVEPVSGGFRGAKPPFGLLDGEAPWGPTGLLVLYERATLLLDEQLEPRAELLLPAVEGRKTAGSNPQGTLLHYGGAYGELYVHHLRK